MLIFHYHLFKNAGTSVDEMLKANFGAEWGHEEFRNPVDKYSNTDEVAEYLKRHPALVAFSSHTALLPLPEIGRPIFPIFFVRHPIDRIKSAYAFERKQIADTHGAQLAKKHDFEGYVSHLLAEKRNRQAHNFQTHRLSCNESPDKGSELERALRTLDALPFVGLVEAYEDSVARLVRMLTPHFPEFKAVIVHKNKTHEKASGLDSKIEEIRRSIPAKLYDDLYESNQDDLVIFDKVRHRYNSA